MFSLQTIFGKGDKFYGLLEASAAAARESARALGELLATPPAQRSLEKFKLARQREKDLAAKISQELVNTFVTAIERGHVRGTLGVRVELAECDEREHAGEQHLVTKSPDHGDLLRTAYASLVTITVRPTG